MSMAFINSFMRRMCVYLGLIGRTMSSNPRALPVLDASGEGQRLTYHENDLRLVMCDPRVADKKVSDIRSTISHLLLMGGIESEGWYH